MTPFAGSLVTLVTSLRSGALRSFHAPSTRLERGVQLAKIWLTPGRSIEVLANPTTSITLAVSVLARGEPCKSEVAFKTAAVVCADEHLFVETPFDDVMRLARAIQ